MSGLYLHIPFCKQACSYCDFYFVTKHDQKQAFVDELVREIYSKKDTRFSQETVQTIYFGGGTPSLLSAAQLEQVLKAISEVFPLDVQECTIEMNPDDVKPDYLREIKNLGITRASMGVQSFDEELLQFMHRAHNREEALNSLEALATAGIYSFTVDLIYGNPGQTLEMLERDIDTLLSYNPPHISAYSLTIEPKTRLGKQFELGRIIPQEDDEVARHIELVIEKLKAAEIHRYEVSNYAKPGHEAKHNSAYWNHVEYLGFGPAAHSFWWDEAGKSARRWNNASDLKGYLSKEWETPNDPENLSLEVLAEEHIMLGFRKVDGIEISRLKECYGFEFSAKQRAYLHQKEKEGKVAECEGRISLTSEGMKIADAITLDVLSM